MKPVDPNLIEKIVGTHRHDTDHMAKAVSSTGQFYLLHPHSCVKKYSDLATCPYSKSFDNYDISEHFPADRPVHVIIDRGQLIPWSNR